MNKSEFEILKSKGLFPLENEGEYIVYAPLANACFGASRPDIERMEEAMGNGGLSTCSEYGFIENLIRESKDYKFRQHTPYGLTGLSILPTWNCNFNCTYCYAANAHKRKNIELATVDRAINFFFENMGAGEVVLQILGGGEPFIEWELVRYIARKAREAERAYNRGLTLSVATNGSVMKEEIMRDIADLDIRLSFSFDVLEDIQTRQRASFALVSHNLKKLLAHGLGDRIYLRTVITRHSVTRMREIADEVIGQYPGICGLIAEPVMGLENFDSLDDYSDFCNLFYTHFKATRKYAAAQGLNFTTMALRNVDYSINYGCEGDFCVTPDGEISICHRLAAPKKTGIEKPDVYGTVTADHLELDSEKYMMLLGPGVEGRKECEGCFAKYNCGGGCIARNLNETPQSKQIYCNLFRRILKDELIQRFDYLNDEE